MSDKDLDRVCRECGKTFTFSQADAAYFDKRGWPKPPERCRACRMADKRRETPPKAQPDAQPAFATGDPNEYRSPMDCAYPSAPLVRDMRRARPAPAAEDDTSEDDLWARDPNAVGDPNEYRSPMQTGDPSRPGGAQARRFPRRPTRGDDARAHAYRRQVVGDTSEYRSPMGGQLLTPDDARARDRNGAPRPSPRGQPQEEPKRPRRPRVRPMFDAVCAACGAAAQVPFEPKPGREVYCSTCFAERRGQPRDETATQEG